METGRAMELPNAEVSPDSYWDNRQDMEGQKPVAKFKKYETRNDKLNYEPGKNSLGG